MPHASTQLRLVAKPPVTRQQASNDEVAQRRLRVICPLVTPSGFPRLRAQFQGKRGKLISLIARQWGISERTIYHWLKAWKRGGVAALSKTKRVDAGSSVVLNAVALEFLLAAAVPGPSTDREMSVRQIHTAYLLAGDTRRAYPHLFKPEEQLPRASYETVRTWIANIPNLVRAIAKTRRSPGRQI